MSKLQLIGMVISGAAICAAVAWWMIRVIRAKNAQLLVLEKQSLADQHYLQGLAPQMRELADQLVRTTAERQDALRKAEEYRALNESVMKQRDQWTRLYDQQAIAHGNAQVWMLEENERLVRQLRAHGVQVKVSPAIREVHESFLQEHVNPVLTRTGTETVHRGNQVTLDAAPEGQG